MLRAVALLAALAGLALAAPPAQAAVAMVCTNISVAGISDTSCPAYVPLSSCLPVEVVVGPVSVVEPCVSAVPVPTVCFPVRVLVSGNGGTVTTCVAG